MNLRQVLLLTLLVLPLCSVAQKLTLASPAGNISITIENKDSIYYSVNAGGGKVILPSAIALITNQGSLGIRPVVSGKQSRSVNETILNPVHLSESTYPINSTS